MPQRKQKQVDMRHQIVRPQLSNDDESIIRENFNKHEVIEDEQGSMGIDDLQELLIEDEEEVEYEDSDYKPEKEVDLPSPKRNPPRRRRQPIRYPASEYEVNVIGIKKKQSEIDHTTFRKNITMLHIIAILLLFIINETNAQIVNDTKSWATIVISTFMWKLRTSCLLHGNF